MCGKQFDAVFKECFGIIQAISYLVNFIHVMWVPSCLFHSILFHVDSAQYVVHVSMHSCSCVVQGVLLGEYVALAKQLFQNNCFPVKMLLATQLFPSQSIIIFHKLGFSRMIVLREGCLSVRERERERELG